MSPIARFKPVLFPLIEQIRSCRAEIDNLRASIPILLHQRAPFAVIRVAHADAAAYDAPSLIRSVITLVAHAHERRRTHVRITHHAFTVACVPFASRRPSSVVFVSRRRPSGVSRLASRVSRALARSLARTLLAQAPDGDARHLSAHDEIGMVLALRARSSVVGGVAVSLSSLERLKFSRARVDARVAGRASVADALDIALVPSRAP